MPATGFRVNTTDIDNLYIPKSHVYSSSDQSLWMWGNFPTNLFPLGNGFYWGEYQVVKRNPIMVDGTSKWSTLSGSSALHGVKTDGTLWGCSSGNSLLGNGSGSSSSSFVQIGADTNWSTVLDSDHHVLALKTNGTLWAWGVNTYGELGQGNVTTNTSPVQIGTGTNWSQIAITFFASLAIKTDGTLWSWGRNTDGTLGQNNATDYSSPVQIGALTNWSKIYGGGYNVVAIKTDGTLWTWGRGNEGQLGQSSTVSVSSPVQVGAGTNWSAAAAHQATNVIALKTDGTLWVWGSNQYGQLGLNDTTTRSSPVQVGTGTSWTKIANGRFSHHAIKSDGSLWCAGLDVNLGIGTASSRSSFVLIDDDYRWSNIFDGGTSIFGVRSSGFKYYPADENATSYYTFGPD